MRPAALLLASSLIACSGTGSQAQQPAPGTLPFKVENIGKFDTPFGMAFLPDARLLVTEKKGALKLRAADGRVIDVRGVPTVAVVTQGGLLDVAVAPDFATSKAIYLTYSEPRSDGSALALMRATLDEVSGTATLGSPTVIWRSGSDGKGGQFGAVIAFAPDGKSLFLSSGERQRFTPAQDPDQALGKIVHLTLDGKPAPGNPSAGKVGAKTVQVIDPPRNTGAAAGAPKRPAQVDGTAPAATWSFGHRNPYGLAFDAKGQLWETEMGPKGGDELNLVVKGRNYGFPNASNGDNYDGSPIPDHAAGDGFEAPKLFWNPSISPGGFMIYSGNLFPNWQGSGFIAALSGQSLIRVTLGDTPAKADQWRLDMRIRDVTQAPDGSIWLLQDGGGDDQGKLMRLTPQ